MICRHRLNQRGKVLLEDVLAIVILAVAVSSAQVAAGQAAALTGRSQAQLVAFAHMEELWYLMREGERLDLVEFGGVWRAGEDAASYRIEPQPFGDYSRLVKITVDGKHQHADPMFEMLLPGFIHESKEN